MKILFVTYSNPLNSRSGDAVYTLDVLAGLKKLGCFISFLSFNNGEFEESDTLKLYNYCNEVDYVSFKKKSKISLLLSVYPLSIANRRSKKLVRKINHYLRQEAYDYIVINHFKLSYVIRFINKGKHRTVLISHNIETNLARSLFQNTSSYVKRILYYIEYLKVKVFEKRYLNGFDKITAISDLDLLYIKNTFVKSKGYFLPPKVKIRTLPQNNNLLKKVILCGSFMWDPKIENLLRLINAKNFNRIVENDIELLIVGTASEDLVSKVNSNYPGVRMVGYVDDTEEFYIQSSIAIVPELLGGGFKMKIAEAVSYNRAIVALRVAITDLQMIDGIHYIGADSFEQMIEVILELIHDEARINFITKNARELFINKYSEEAVNNTLKEVFLTEVS